MAGKKKPDGSPPDWWPWPGWFPPFHQVYPEPPPLPGGTIPPPPDTSPPWAFPNDVHSKYSDYPDPFAEWDYGSSGKKKKRKSKKGARMPRRTRPKKPPMIRARTASGAGSAGRTSHSTVYTQSDSNGGAMPVLDLSGSSEGLTDVLVELVDQGSISLGRAMQLFATEQDRLANRLWRRPGGLARTTGL